MAKPRYIVCSENRIVDQASRLVSHINVIDRIVINAVRLEPNRAALPESPGFIVPKLPIATLVVTASWAKESTDSEKDVYEFETIMRKPDGTETVIHHGEFQFEKRFYRIDTGVVFTTHTQFSTGGELTFESRIRVRGAEAWQSQSFPLDIDVVSITEESPAADSANQ